MYSSSAAFTLGCSDGTLYTNVHMPSHMKPSAPITTNAISQPSSLASGGMLSGANSAPIDAPALKMEVAYARSFFGKYSAVTLIAAGKLPASPIARIHRAAMKKHMLTVAMSTARSDPACTALNAAASGRQTHHSVAMPHKAWRQAPADHMPMAHM